MYKVYKFANGLKLLYAKNDINKSTAVEIGFASGSMCDGKLPGLAHFCEHMFFTGTKTENKAEISKQYFDLFKVNAFTNYKRIAFTGEIFTKDLATYLNLVAKMITESGFTKQAVEDEKKVVLQEIAKDNDKFSRKASRLFSYLKYNEEFYDVGILGTEETVSKITSADVKKFVNKYFIASNCVVYVVSPLSFNKVRKMVDKCFGSKLNQDKKVKVRDLSMTGVVKENKMAFYHKDIDKNYLSLCFSCGDSKLNLRESLTLNMLCFIMSDISDGLSKDLRLKNNLVYYSDVYDGMTKVDQAINICTECSKENINPCVDIVCDYLKRLLEVGISQEMLDKEKRRLRYCFETKVYRPVNYIEDMSNIFWHGKIVTDLEEYKIFQTITIEELNEMFKRFFKAPCFKAMVYGNAEKKDIYSMKVLENKFGGLKID